MRSAESIESVGHIPSGLFIVTVGGAEGELIDGYLASWIQQTSFKPPMIAVAVRPGRPAYDRIKAGNTFTVNIVGDHDKTYLKHFWKGYDPNNNPFSEISHQFGQNGGIILNQAKSAIECRMINSTQPGDHDIIFAEVLASYVLNEESRPMVHIRKSGADY
jgi:flavin reductase (DIM6/NTAB) family NADH-FMN oxidoreductase RutF